MLSFLSASFAQPKNDLSTTNGHALGLTVSRYIYREPCLMSNRGFKAGIEYTGTYALKKWFAKPDLRYASGKVKYDGSGTANDNINYYYDFRLLVGKDFEINGQLLAPYIGYGYRYLFNDTKGFTSTGHCGYPRESNYWYVPIGLTHRTSLPDQTKLETTIEYNYFIKGKQVSKFSDVSNAQDLRNKQSKGYGFRLSMIYNQDDWSVGPYYHYWNIKKSKISNVYVNGQLFNIGWEPKNHTNELGFKFSSKF